jgi:dTDP-4-dehydrorhamnose 3,5-epimerase
MDNLNDISGAVLTPLKIIVGEAGRVLHAIKAGEIEGGKFGEVYFSSIKNGSIKGWKRHREMVLNIVVPIGAIKFHLLDDRVDRERVATIELGPEVNYQRLTVPAGIWMAFEGVGAGESLLMNIASIPHDPSECDTLPLGDSKFASFKL